VECSSFGCRVVVRLFVCGQKVQVQCLGSPSVGVGPRLPVARVAVSRPHGERHALVPDRKAAGKVPAGSVGGGGSCWAAAITEEVWQYQRRVDVTGQWKPPFMPVRGTALLRRPVRRSEQREGGRVCCDFC
jgi:hypothetical protein